jgi:tripartite-type tricarboxylate transporter receptor subunit TctC
LRTLMLCGLLAAAGQAHAEPYPDKPIKLLVPGAAGGPTDVMARVVADGLGTRLGQKFVIDNRGGAGGMIAGEVVAHAPADGYSLLYANSSTQAINPALYPSMPYDPATAFAPIALISVAPMILVVNPSVPAHTVAEFVTLAAARPGGLNVASGGTGTLPHLTYELFRLASGLEGVHVPYTGGVFSLAAVVAGEVPATFEVVSIVRPRARSGALRALATTWTVRDAVLADVPTMAESGYPDVLAVSWTGLVAPAGLADDRRTVLNRALNQLIADPGFRAKLDALGVTPRGGTPGDFAAWIADERARWTRVVAVSGAKPN